MTATLEQTQSDLPRLVKLAQQGEDVVITENGESVARITSAAEAPGRAAGIAWSERKQAWLARRAASRAAIGTGPQSVSIQEILDDDRRDR